MEVELQSIYIDRAVSLGKAKKRKRKTILDIESNIF